MNSRSVFERFWSSAFKISVFISFPLFTLAQHGLSSGRIEWEQSPVTQTSMCGLCFSGAREYEHCHGIQWGIWQSLNSQIAGRQSCVTTYPHATSLLHLEQAEQTEIELHQGSRLHCPWISGPSPSRVSFASVDLMGYFKQTSESWWKHFVF